MTNIVRLPLGLALLLLAPLAAGQSNLGELLDTGAQKLSAEEFRRDIVQRPIVGPTPAGSTIELMYVANGSIVGMGNMVAAKVRSRIHHSVASGRSMTQEGSAPACNIGIREHLWWFLGGFAAALSNVVQVGRCVLHLRFGFGPPRQGPSTHDQAGLHPVAPQSNLGALLDAGSEASSRPRIQARPVVRRTSSALPDGGTIEIVYAANGSFRGQAALAVHLEGGFSGDMDDRRTTKNLLDDAIRYRRVQIVLPEVSAVSTGSSSARPIYFPNPTRIDARKYCAARSSNEARYKMLAAEPRRR